MLVKICGITSREDALAAAKAGAAAIGFNFYRGSRRYITPEAAARIGEGLDIIKVGVFVDELPATVEDIASRAGLDIIQLHGDETPESLPSGLRIWKAFRVAAGWKPALTHPYEVEAVLLDGHAPGSGEAFDWKIAMPLRHRIILAGGLDESNVGTAIRTLSPWGVDACSRLEKAPGVKDHLKMRRFIEAALSESSQ